MYTSRYFVITQPKTDGLDPHQAVQHCHGQQQGTEEDSDFLNL